MSGSQDGLEYLVMEYLEGETMAARLGRGPLPLEKVFEYGIQIADALDQAHRQGVIHRDLKPGNVMLTKSGAKLLDFGLAKTDQVTQNGTGSHLPTRTLTTQGSILGTCQYMSPELLNGKDADPRSDIFALGAVLYEMITGRRAFHGKTQAGIIASILEHEPPPLSSTQMGTGEIIPPNLEHLVRTCLAKDPEQRRQTAHDVLLELRWIAEGGSHSGITRPAAHASRIAARAPCGQALSRCCSPPWRWDSCFTAGAHRKSRGCCGRRCCRRKRPRSWPAACRRCRPTAGASSSPPAAEGHVQLYVRDLDLLATRALPGTDGADDPFWSPDGRSVGFFARGKLRKVDVAGGPAVSLCDASQGRGGSWSSERHRSSSRPILRVRSSACRRPVARPTPVTTLDAARAARFRIASPGSCRMAAIFFSRAEVPIRSKNAIYVADLESKQQRRLLDVSSNAAYAPPGFLLFVRERTLMAQSFDAGSLHDSAASPFPSPSRWN